MLLDNSADPDMPDRVSAAEYCLVCCKITILLHLDGDLYIRMCILSKVEVYGSTTTGLLTVVNDDDSCNIQSSSGVQVMPPE